MTKQTTRANKRAKHNAFVEALVPVAQRLADRFYVTGVTASDLRVHGQNEGVLTGTENAAQLSALGSVFRRAGLVTNGETRRSHIPSTHGIRQSVWYHSDSPYAAE